MCFQDLWLIEFQWTSYTKESKGIKTKQIVMLFYSIELSDQSNIHFNFIENAYCANYSNQTLFSLWEWWNLSIVYCKF